MTQDQDGMSAEERAGRALVAKSTFAKEAVWLPSLAVQHWNAGLNVIEGKTFTECLIEGPALMAVMAGTTFDSCMMGTSSDMRNLLYRSVGKTKLAGVVGMANCKFVRCRFSQVAFTGSDELIDDLAGIQTLSDSVADKGGAA